MGDGMIWMYKDEDANTALIRARKVGIIGYGSQGHAHALNLRDNGIDVRVGLPESSSSVHRAQNAGFDVASPAEIAKWADVVMLLIPDTHQAVVYEHQIRQEL